MNARPGRAAGTRRAVAAVTVATAGAGLALVLAGWSHGLVLFAYVLFVGAVTVMVITGRLRAALPPAVPFERLLPTRPRPTEQAGQLETIMRGLSAAGYSQAELHHRLAPMTREIAAGRLSRRHGVDLNRQPERAHALIGDGRVWDLVRRRQGPLDNAPGSGWSRQHLEELLDELERI